MAPESFKIKPSKVTKKSTSASKSSSIMINSHFNKLLTSTVASSKSTEKMILQGNCYDYKVVHHNKKYKLLGSHGISYRPLAYNLPLKEPTSNPKFFKFAAFDLDDTLIQTKSGVKFARGPTDWKFKYQPKMMEKFRKLIDDKFTIVIFTNQGGVVNKQGSKSLSNLISKLDGVLAGFPSDMPIFIYGSTKKGKGDENGSHDTLHEQFRKPNTGMFLQLLSENKIDMENVDLENSLFVGDAAGRKGDFSDSDLQFAKQLKVKFLTPEEYFN